MLQGLSDLVFPSLCEHCRDRASSHVPLCWRCIRRLEPVKQSSADRVLFDLPVIDQAVSIRCLWYFDREGPLRDVVHAMKYENRPWYGCFLGRCIADSGFVSRPVDLIVPMPLHPLRSLERGYNQAHWIATEMAKILGVSLAGDALHRTKPTRTQTALSRRDRWTNVCDAFRVSGDILPSAPHVILVDDVVTTGSTALSAALALEAAGARSVTIAAAGLARA